MRRLVLTVAVLVVAACKKEEAAPSSSSAAPTPARATPAAPIAPDPTDPWNPAYDPTTAPTVDGKWGRATTLTELATGLADTVLPDAGQLPSRLQAYLALLAIDLYLDEWLGTFPGVATSTRFTTDSYRWGKPRDLATGIEAPLAEAAKRARHGDAAVDTAVRAYVDTATSILPDLVDLHAYYAERRFVDDEFARGRRDAPNIATWTTKLAAVRRALWAEVLSAWRAGLTEDRESPRTVVTNAWEACVRVGEVLVARNSTDAQRDAAVSACRRGIPPVVALPGSVRGKFDEIVRDTAVELGDHVARRWKWSGYEIPSEIAELTREYLALWPKLPAQPAERPAP